MQATAQTGIGTTTPNASAKLDVFSTTKGFLPPRVALTSTSSFSPITGLAIIRVGEEHPIPIAPQKNTDVVYASRVVYTWRQWDLIDNVQMNVIRTCDPNNDPLEDY